MKTYKVKVNGKTYEVVLEAVNETSGTLTPNKTDAKIETPKDVLVSTGEGVKAPIAGKLIKYTVKVGDSIKKGDVVAVIEAMKLENEVPSPFAGVVKKLSVNPGDHVENGTLIVEFGK